MMKLFPPSIEIVDASNEKAIRASIQAIDPASDRTSHAPRQLMLSAPSGGVVLLSEGVGLAESIAIALAQLGQSPTGPLTLAVVPNGRGPDSGTGLAFSSDPVSGEPGLAGQFRQDATGAQLLMCGGDDLAAVASKRPWGDRLAAFVAREAQLAGRPVRVEFVVEQDELFVLAVTPAVLHGPALLQYTAAALERGDLAGAEALLAVGLEDLSQALAPSARVTGLAPAASGLAAASGIAGGTAVFSAAAAVAAQATGHPCVLILRASRPEDLPGLLAAVAVVTERGGVTSHGAVVARGLGRVCVTALTDATVRSDEEGLFPAVGEPIRPGDHVTVDANSGTVYRGLIDQLVVAPPAETAQAIDLLLRHADQCSEIEVRVNADSPADTLAGRQRGATGVGLCRVEHMLLGGRMPLLVDILLGEASAAVGEALAELQQVLQDDFAGILRAMDGHPVTVRLLDPPRHEFLPDLADPQAAAALADDPDRLAAIRRLRETNPMLGVRGVRLAALDPHLLTAQLTALVTAAERVRREGGDPRPQLLIPMVALPAEVDLVRRCLSTVCSALGLPGDAGIPVGAMVETPRAVLCAGDLARTADFLSIGSNDLTALVWGISRDDADRELLPRYRRLGLLSQSPFTGWDTTGVGEAIRHVVTVARRVKPSIGIGVCGEHAADASAVDLFGRLLIDYVSCSLARLPVARFTAGRAAVRSRHPEPGEAGREGEDAQ